MVVQLLDCNKKLSYRWKAARHSCAICNGVWRLTPWNTSLRATTPKFRPFRSKNWERWGLVLLEWAWQTPKRAALTHVCYHAEFGRSSSTSDMWISGGSQKNRKHWGPALRDWGVTDALQTRPSHSGYRSEFTRWYSNGTSVCMVIRQKNWTPRNPPFKVTEGHRNWRGSTYDFLLVVRNNHGPILYRFQDIARYWPKIANSRQPITSIRCPSGYYPSNAVAALKLENYNDGATRSRKEFDDIFIRFGTV